MFSSTFLALRRPPGLNQFGLRPESTYDFLAPTNLVNWGRATKPDNLNTRHLRGRTASPSLDSCDVGRLLPKMLGLSRNSPQENLKFCGSETAALKICMAKGETTCEREHAQLQNCMQRVAPLQEAVVKAGDEYKDWFTQSIGDNRMKPHSHRPHDQGEYYAAQKTVRARSSGRNHTGKHPKPQSWAIRHFRPKGMGLARKSRLPANA